MDERTIQECLDEANSYLHWADKEDDLPRAAQYAQIAQAFSTQAIALTQARQAKEV